MGTDKTTARRELDTSSPEAIRRLEAFVAANPSKATGMLLGFFSQRNFWRSEARKAGCVYA